jgi:hypothetical protein
MDAAAIKQFIVTQFAGVDAFDAPNGDTFFFTDPKRFFPFATLVHGDDHDQASNLGRPGVFRLNIGVRKATFQSRFPDASAAHDFTALDRVLPHPVYAAQYFVCVLNPSDGTFERDVKPLLAEAYAVSVERYGKGSA